MSRKPTVRKLKVSQDNTILAGVDWTKPMEPEKFKELLISQLMKSLDLMKGRCLRSDSFMKDGHIYVEEGLTENSKPPSKKEREAITEISRTLGLMAIFEPRLWERGGSVLVETKHSATGEKFLLAMAGSPGGGKRITIFSGIPSDEEKLVRIFSRA